MNPDDIKKLLDRYYEWLKDKTSVRAVNDTWTEITTPFLDTHNDYMQIYAKKEDGIITLTDDGYVISDLENCGCSFESEKRKKALSFTLNRFGVSCKDGALLVTASEYDFPIRKQDLIQAMLSVSDMFYLSAPSVQSFFIEDVENWLIQNNVPYFSDFKLTGKSGYNHSFDFAIPKTSGKKERIIQAINNPTKENISQLIFKWLDMKEVRKEESSLIVVLNDNGKKIPEQTAKALQNYDTAVISWANKKESASLIA